MVDEGKLRQAALSIASIEGLRMDPDALLEDVYLLAYAFPDQDDFMVAVASTARAIGNLRAGRVTPAQLKYGFEGWSSFRYQHHIEQGSRADCRIVFRRIDEDIEVKGFGHRRIPKDLYLRLADSRKDGGAA